MIVAWIPETDSKWSCLVCSCGGVVGASRLADAGGRCCVLCEEPWSNDPARLAAATAAAKLMAGAGEYMSIGSSGVSAALAEILLPDCPVLAGDYKNLRADWSAV